MLLRAMMHLTEAIEEGTPAGLKELGDWETITKACLNCQKKQKRAGSSLITSIPIVHSLYCSRRSLARNLKRWWILAVTRVNGQCSAAITMQTLKSPLSIFRSS
eukprot:TRINITY_DN22469_c0_g1_i1.p1 TRINITY_DN22469_c0_g1~~TRINITY_DN22469_c0_g1_i1.p1  ORF type:complete len:104 (+),score=1.42 TRINITY_DN22469_c0_g1_i1:207-518(+)